MRGLSADEPSARRRVALSLDAEDDRDAVPLAEAALNEADPNVVGAMYWAFARIGDRAVPVLADALNSPLADRRHRAMAALQKIKSPQASAALADAFGRSDPLVSRPALFARGRLGQAGAIPALVTAVVAGTDDVEPLTCLQCSPATTGPPTRSPSR